MSKSLFVSHVFEDRNYVDKIRSWASKGLLGDVVVTGEDGDVRQGGSKAIKEMLSPKLKGAAAVIVLVGKDTHDRRWVEYEVNHALSHRKQVIVMRIPGTRGAAPPNARKLPILPFNSEQLRSALGT